MASRPAPRPVPVSSPYLGCDRTHLRISQTVYPEAQGLAAIQWLMECGAYPLIQKGMIADAITKAAPIWASLPRAGYEQREHQLVQLLEIYEGGACHRAAYREGAGGNVLELQRSAGMNAIFYSAGYWRATRLVDDKQPLAGALQ